MKIERHETGPRMSKAVIHGDTVYLAGIVADGPKGKSVAEQTKNILSQIDGFLALAGSVWDSWVSPGNTPARATVEAKLASPDYKVEIMVVAAR
jgi:enamine deaminase RidA (YjgF/YER057c/UK114 family)